jgi:hypothetical protein
VLVGRFPPEDPCGATSGFINVETPDTLRNSTKEALNGDPDALVRAITIIKKLKTDIAMSEYLKAAKRRLLRRFNIFIKISEFSGIQLE